MRLCSSWPRRTMSGGRTFRTYNRRGSPCLGLLLVAGATRFNFKMSTRHVTTMRAWQWSSCTDGLENALQLADAVPIPTVRQPLGLGECLIQVHAAALNPVDYKLAELPVVGRVAIRKPATPGLDFSGRVVEVGPDCHVCIGQMVFGKLEPKQQFGTLGEYIVGSKTGTVPLPDGVSAEHAATLGVCGLVTYQCLTQRQNLHQWWIWGHWLLCSPNRQSPRVPRYNNLLRLDYNYILTGSE
jgi:D-arabinose 1-dehydrogenase-like Zn-dependent alcohol dehydrogenase